MLSPLANAMIANPGYGACSSAVTTWESKLHLHSREIEPDVVRAFECPSEMVDIASRYMLLIFFLRLLRGEVALVSRSQDQTELQTSPCRVSFRESKQRIYVLLADVRHEQCKHSFEELSRYCEKRIITRCVPLHVIKLPFLRYFSHQFILSSIFQFLQNKFL